MEQKLTLEPKSTCFEGLAELYRTTGNPAYRDVLYVEELIGPDTVNTLPVATMDAFRDQVARHRGGE